MNRIEINVQTGERKAIDLTQQEEADAVARSAAESAANAARPKPLTVDALVHALKTKGILADKDIEDAKAADAAKEK